MERVCLRQRFDLGVQAALVTGSLVFMDDAFVGHAVDHGNRCGVSSLGVFFVAGQNGGLNFLDTGAHHGAEAGIVLAVLLGLASTFFCRCNIGHGITSVLLAIPGRAGRILGRQLCRVEGGKVNWRAIWQRRQPLN